MGPSPIVVLVTILSIRILCANFSIINDCDEIFNYYEPLHYLTHGFGLQTWEYSGEYAIRSWAYIWVHAAVVKAAQLTGITEKKALFYVLRYAFAVLSAAAETSLFFAIARNISSRVAVWYLLISGLSTGMMHASISFLPSSFAMHMFTFSFSRFLNFRSTHRSCDMIASLAFAAVGAFLGWPFSLLIVVPFVIHYSLTSLASKRVGEFFKTGISSLAVASVILGLIVAIDSMCYQKLAIVPWNIVSYNVLFASDDAGPEIFGVEPWTYYVGNLLLNFNIAFPLSLLAVFVLVAPHHFKLNRGQLLATISPFFLWFGVLIYQPHKEERFLYVGYPSLALNAALAFEVFAGIVSSIGAFVGIKRIVCRFLYVMGFITLFSAVSISRSAALYHYYGGSLLLYQHIPAEAPGTVCIGREWYRYPSSYFLQDDQRLKFIKSGFSGLLPGSFDETPGPWWNRPGTSLLPEGMNNKNVEDMAKYVDIDECDYIIDTSAAVNEEEGEVQYTDSLDWERLICSKFINTEKSRGIGRVLWLPESLNKLTGTEIVWDDYCLMKNVW